MSNNSLSVKEAAEGYFQDTVAMRRDLHKHPEAGDQIIRQNQ